MANAVLAPDGRRSPGLVCRRPSTPMALSLADVAPQRAKTQPGRRHCSLPSTPTRCAPPGSPPAGHRRRPRHRTAADRPSARPEVMLTMPTRPYDPWRDTDGAPIPQHCRIEQIAVHRDHGALPSRLHQQGQVLGRGTNRLIVKFDDQNKVVSIRPHLVRVLTTPDGG